jgi:hypothetical protein
MMGMLNAVCLDHFDAAIIPLERKTDLVNGIAFLDLLEDSLIPLCIAGSPVETFFDRPKKTVMCV